MIFSEDTYEQALIELFRELGFNYELKDIRPATEKDIEKVKKILNI